MASSSNETVDFWNTIPPGFRFDPKDEELITDYLVKKINGEALPPNKMHETVLYGVLGPQDLTLYYEPESENTWYFFTRLEKLYENGSRLRRSAGNGYWKASGVDATIRNKQGITIGYRKALAFFIKIEPALKNKNEPKGIKTPWLMHEFKLNNNPSTSEPKNMLDGWVLCKVYRLARDVEVEALNQEEEHLHREEEQHQAIEQPVVLNIGANDHVLVPAIGDSFEHLQRNYQEEQHQAIALNIGANDHVLVPAIEDSCEHLQRNYQEEQHQAFEQHVALNYGDNHHLLIPEIEDSFEHQQRNEDMPRLSQEELEFLYNIFPC